MGIKVTVTNKEQKKVWKRVLGTTTVDVRNFLPVEAKVCGKIRLVYWMDVAKLSDEQKENLIEHLARQFKDEIKKSDNYHQKNPESYVRENLNQIGVPILADNCYAYMSGSMLF